MPEITTITSYHCSNMLKYSVVCSATKNNIDNTITITAEYYLDNTEQYGIAPTIPANKDANSSMTIAGQTQFFKAPKISGKGNYLLYTFVSKPIPAEDEKDTRIAVGASHYIGDKIYSSFHTYYSVGNLVMNKEIIVSAIKRRATIEVFGDLTLGTENELNVIRPNDVFTHSIAYKCGTETGVIRTKSTDETIKFTLPVELASQETERDSLPVEFTTTTYNGDTEILTKTITVTYAMPASVKPSCSILISDGSRDKNGVTLLEKYGGYVQRQSRFNIKIVPTLSYGSPIDSYEVSANGTVYDTAESVTEVIQDGGINTITATVTDKRGRSGTISLNVDVLPWSEPRVFDLRPHRTNADGVEESGGEYITIDFKAEVSPLNNKNSAVYMLRYQKTSGLDQNDVDLTDYDNVFSVAGARHIFEADPSSPYEITVFATDDFTTGSRTIGGSNAVTLLNFGADGESIGIGTIAKIAKALEVAFKLYPSGGFIFPELVAGNGLNFCTTPNVYFCENGQDISNCPTDDPFTLEILPVAHNKILQRVTTCPSSGRPQIFVRHLKGSSWTEWDELAYASDIPNYAIFTGTTLIMQRKDGEKSRNLFEVEIST